MIWIKMQKSRRGRRPYCNTALFKASAQCLSFCVFCIQENESWRGAIYICVRQTLEKV